MSIKSRILVHPERSAKISKELFIEHPVYPKSKRASRAVEAVTAWARALPIYRGKTIFVDDGTLKALGEDGEGQVFVDGALVSRFSVTRVPDPEPVSALFAVDGDDR